MHKNTTLLIALMIFTQINQPSQVNNVDLSFISNSSQDSIDEYEKQEAINNDSFCVSVISYIDEEHITYQEDNNGNND